LDLIHAHAMGDGPVHVVAVVHEEAVVVVQLVVREVLAAEEGYQLAFGFHFWAKQQRSNMSPSLVRQR